MNIQTILLLALVLAAAVRALLSLRKRGRGSCGGNCAHCSCTGCAGKRDP